MALIGARALAQRGYRVILFCSAGPPEPELAENGVDVVCCNQNGILDDPNRLRAARQGIWNRTAAVEFEKLLESHDRQWTLIHVHSWTRSLSSSIIPVALDKKFRLILHNHDYSLACPNGAFFNYRKNRICEFNPLSAACILSNCDKRSPGHKLWRIFRQSVQRRWGKIPVGIHHIVTVSAFSRSILEPFITNSSTVYTVDNPISIEKDEPVTPSENSYFASVGRIDPEKGPRFFARAAMKARVKPFFIGDGECRDDVLKVCPSSEITGWLPNHEVVKMLRKSRALVLPSLWYETFGLVVAEAAALGIPAIVPDTSAARELVINGETGLWFRRADVEDLAEKMRLLLDDRIVDKMGKAAYEHYWKNPYSVERHVAELENIYAEILKQPL